MTDQSQDTATLRPVTPTSILAGRLEQLRQNLSMVSAIDESVRTDLDEICAIASGLDPYLDRCTTPSSVALQALAERTAAHDWKSLPGSGTLGLEAEMLSGHVEGQVLSFLVEMLGATTVLEVGMFTGYSALAMAEALPVDGRVLACEIDPDVAEFAQECFAESPDGYKIGVAIGPALDTLHRLAANDEVFDLVFIDADKAGYCDYFDAVLDGGLLAQGGLICVDNTLMQGQPYLEGEHTANGVAVSRFNEHVVADDRVKQVLLPVRDGLTLIRRV
ncbi:MAG: caffeoyl-CoA O-methyltransferase [Ilumatobacter sp.]|jgi:caffeoyl-CoA O-methyltransferase